MTVESSARDQRPVFEQLVKRMAREILEPAGFAAETSRRWTRSPSSDFTHIIEWQKGKWTRSSDVHFYVNLTSLWLSGPPNRAFGDSPQEWIPPVAISDRLTIDASDPDMPRVAEPWGKQSRVDQFVLRRDTDLDLLIQVLRRRFRDQVLPRLDSVATVSDCVEELREPDRSIPKAQTLLLHFAAAGDRAAAQEQYWRLRRHFADRGFPREQYIRQLVEQLALSEPQ